ncbi:hypothetical protein [Streptomyces sp. NPDC059894]|uniref:hypothetical protein n=1 Tax=unclassified Streptomyces TaxID=2593676 RepID=UPI0036571C7C
MSMTQRVVRPVRHVRHEEREELRKLEEGRDERTDRATAVDRVYWIRCPWEELVHSGNLESCPS